MSKKLFVGNLAFNMTEEQLNSLFTKHGQVSSAKLIIDKLSGRSRGFGFVEMANDAEADDAIKNLNGSTFEERQIVVNEARPMQDRKPNRSFGGDRFGGDKKPRKGGFDRGRGKRGGGNRW